jgi:Family of unknown function (DUF5808)
VHSTRANAFHTPEVPHTRETDCHPTPYVLESVHRRTYREEEVNVVKRTGTFLKIPYDLRKPTPEIIRERMWNPKDHRILTPRAFGWGYSINLYEVLRRLGLKRDK